MELTVIRVADQRRMVVAIDARNESEALRAIRNAVGAVTLAPQQVPPRSAPGAPPRRHARHSSYF